MQTHSLSTPCRCATTPLQAGGRVVAAAGNAETSAVDEMETAAGLLGIRSDAELDRFLGNLFARTLRGASAFAASPAGQQAMGLLKATAKQALPQIGRAVGAAVGGTSGAAQGQRLADDAGRLMGLELEGLSHEDSEFEVARQWARLAQDTLRPLDPRRASARQARHAFRQAARQHAPGLFLHRFQPPAERPFHEPRSTTMHNLDRVLTQQETFAEAEYSGNEFEAFDQEYGGGYAQEYQGEYNEAELAAELLTVSSEAELDQFFGKIFKTVSKIANSPVGRIVGGALKQAAKSALPSVGAALGSMIPIPGVGTALGGMAGKALANALEMETAGLSMEDREFEVAQGVVRMAANAARAASSAPPSANPAAVASSAIKSAIGSLQPPVASHAGPGALGRRAQQGRWIRRGNSIVILGV